MRRRILVGAPLIVSALALSGCMSSPTYGTGKTANAQLMDDLTGIVAIGGSREKKDPIAYTPRPELVKPAARNQMALVAPQEAMNNSAQNPNWPESPEARLARIRADATENQDNPRYRSPVVKDIVGESVASTGRHVDPERAANDTVTRQQREEYNRRFAENSQGSAAQRKFLSEPPLTYRAPEATAPTGDVGEDEWKKERAAKRAARKKGSGGFLDGIREALPF